MSSACSHNHTYIHQALPLQDKAKAEIEAKKKALKEKQEKFTSKLKWVRPAGLLTTPSTPPRVRADASIPSQGVDLGRFSAPVPAS